MIPTYFSKEVQRIFLGVFLLALSSCFSFKPTGGTDIGNPGGRQSEAFSASLNTESCRILEFCLSGFPEDPCREEALHARGVGKYMGGPEAYSLAELESAVNRLDYKLSSSALQQCRTALNELRCADLPLDRIWSSNDPYNFSRIKNFWEALEPSCGGLVSPNSI